MVGCCQSTRRYLEGGGDADEADHVDGHAAHLPVVEFSDGDAAFAGELGERHASGMTDAGNVVADEFPECAVAVAEGDATAGSCRFLFFR